MNLSEETLEELKKAGWVPPKDIPVLVESVITHTISECIKRLNAEATRVALSDIRKSANLKDAMLIVANLSPEVYGWVARSSIQTTLNMIVKMIGPEKAAAVSAIITQELPDG